MGTARAEAVAAADGIGYPVVLKALGLLHKSDAGGVALGLDATMSAPDCVGENDNITLRKDTWSSGWCQTRWGWR